MDRKGAFVLLCIALLFTGCGNHAAVTTENMAENTVGESTENSTEDSIENEADAGVIEIPEALPQNAAVYKAKSTYYEDGEVSVIWMRSYDERDNILSEEKIDPVSGEGMGTLFGEHAYIYNQEGQIQVEFFGTVDSYETYQYHENGKIREHCRYTGGELEEKKEYTYDDHGNEIKEVETRYFSEGEEPLVSEQITGYLYDDNGNMTESISYDEEGDVSFRCGFEYDEMNQMVKSYILKGDGTEYLTYEAYTYDDNGNLLREDTYGRENVSDSFEIGSSTVYEYDAKNRRIKEERYVDGILTRYTITEYEDVAN